MASDRLAAVFRVAELLPLAVHASKTSATTRPGELPPHTAVQSLRRRAERLGGLPAAAAELMRCYPGLPPSSASESAAGLPLLRQQSSGSGSTQLKLDVYVAAALVRTAGLSRRPLSALAVRLAEELGADAALPEAALGFRALDNEMVQEPPPACTTAALLLGVLNERSVVNGRMAPANLSAGGVAAVPWARSRSLPPTARRVLRALVQDACMTGGWPASARALESVGIPIQQAQRLVGRIGPHLRPALLALAGGQFLPVAPLPVTLPPEAGELLAVVLLASDLFTVSQLLAASTSSPVPARRADEAATSGTGSPVGARSPA